MTKKRRELSILEKLDIIKKLEKNIERKDIENEYGISKSTISVLWKNKEEIYNESRENNLERKRIRSGKYPKIEQCAIYTKQRQT